MVIHILRRISAAGDSKKLKGAVSLLRDEAYQWWLTVKEGTQREFLKLTQGDRSMAEYEAEFLRLSRYARGMVASEYERKREFFVLVENAKITENVKHAEHQNRNRERGKNKRDLEPSSSVQRLRKKVKSDGPIRVGAPVASAGLQPCGDCEVRQPDFVYTARRREDRDVPDVITEFNIILGMDWLVEHRVSLDCVSKRVVLRTKDDVEVVMTGERRDYLSHVISALVAEKLVRKGCEAYLVYVSVSDSEDSSVGNIRTIKDFLDVFPEELLRLLPNREIEFGIELLLGTALVSITPYRMAPKEFKKLKPQLQELLDHGFIRPSVSPWGASVLFVEKKDETMRMCIGYR
ncbi:Gag protease polyprotein [Gossypium australe]|uniref:Gag protease polyprotein n=1 Tax=Gossypium australe TaxID=47621 RepID=A0A5B6W1M6_9ROSI|nr:Gag protease polyprotein [Gossypium australe]